MPPVADPLERRHEDTLQQDDDLRAFGDQVVGDVPRPWLVAADERVVHPLLLRVEATHAGWTSGRGRAQLGLNRREVASGDAVAATHERRRQAARAHPSVGGLVVHAERIGSLLQLELVVVTRCHHVDGSAPEKCGLNGAETGRRR